jgi:hypothetical protein
VGLERGPLSLMSTTEELLGRKSSSSGLEIREYGRRDPSRCPHGSLSAKFCADCRQAAVARSVYFARGDTVIIILSKQIFNTKTPEAYFGLCRVQFIPMPTDPLNSPCLSSAVFCFTERAHCYALSDGLHSVSAAILANYVRTCYVTYIGLHDTVGANRPVVMNNNQRLYK